MKRLIISVVIAELVSVGAIYAQESLYLSGGEEVTITNPGSMLEASSITVGSGMTFDYGNRLYISNGGYVNCLGSMSVNGTVSTGLDYSWLYSYASITGDGSLLDIGGDLELWSYNLPGRTSGTSDPWGVPCYMEISGGAEVSVVGGVSIKNRSTLRVDSGGKLYASHVIASGGGTIESSRGLYSMNLASVEVSGTGSVWNNSGNLLIGQERHDQHLLNILDGGVVNNVNAEIGEYSLGNQVTVSGAGSQWNNNGNLVIGSLGSTENSLTISGGASVNCSDLSIGGGDAANNNSATVSGSGTVLNSTGNLTIGMYSQRNSLEISDGATVSNVNARISVQWNANYGENSVSVYGSGSKWINSGTIVLGSNNNLDNGNNRLSIGGGAEVIADGGVTINQYGGGGNLLILGNGGRLVVGTDFDASMQGFLYHSGSTLAVEGQLSGLSTLETGHRLETPNVLGDMTVHGTFAPGNSPADSILDGILAMAADGTLEMELAGYLLGDEYDRLTVTDAAYLDGTLDIVLLDDFSVAYGDTFDLFNWDGGVSGEFETITTSALTGTLEWDTSELYTTGTITVIPEPASLSLIGLVAGGIWFTRRFFPAV